MWHESVHCGLEHGMQKKKVFVMESVKLCIELYTGTIIIEALL